jgi:hypothetical protein
MRRTLQAVLLTFAAAGCSAAQVQFGRDSGMARASTLDMTKLQTISGTVSAVAIGYGVQYPSITIGKVQIKIAPIWYLLDNDFELKVGGALSVQTAPARSKSDPYLYAVEIQNTTTNLLLVLRDSSRRPLWTGSPSTSGAQAGGGCTLGSTLAMASGTIEQINSGFGVQMPTLTLRVADGALVTFKLGPERIFLASDLELKVGEQVTVKYASSTCCDELVAIAITNSAGKTVVLRDENGRPGWRLALRPSDPSGGLPSPSMSPSLPQ